uniref:Uncharacterized protein n=1 Tax=uncultured delta proteobacterium TaxID=34034 RepID=H5SLP0_9DELT|nr:hypothetical protein HGMM_F46H12C25 [uncultured delta proteobacterium]
MMTEHGSTGATRRSRRIEEALLEVEGVVGVRVWELPDRVEIGLLVAPNEPPTDVLQRALEVTEALRAPEEHWDVGLLTEPWEPGIS